MRVQRILTAVAASLALSACYTSRVITTPNISAQSPRQISIVRADGTETTIYTPVVEGETIVGRSSGKECLLESCRKPDVSVPVSEVKEVKIRTIDRTKTYALVGLGVATLVTVAIVSKGSGSDASCVLNCSTNGRISHSGASIPTSSVMSALAKMTHGLGAILAH